MKNLPISMLKKKIFLKDLLTRMKDISDSSIEGNLIDEILLCSEFIDYDINDLSEEKYASLIDLYKKIKKTDLIKIIRCQKTLNTLSSIFHYYSLIPYLNGVIF